MKSILIVTSFLPYPVRSGGDQAQYNMIEALRKNYNIGIIFPFNRDNRKTDLILLRSLWPEVRLFPFPRRSQYTYLPFFIHKTRKFINKYLLSFRQKSQINDILDHTDFLTSKTYMNFIQAAIEEMRPDILQVEFIQNLNIGGLLPPNMKKIFVHHEIGFVITDRTLRNVSLSERQERRKEQKKCTEIFRLNQYDGIITLTETDKCILENSGVTPPIFVSPAAVNTREMEFEGWNGEIVFIGGFHHGPNHEGMDWFLTEIAPCIDWSKYPQTQLTIIGLGWPSSYEGSFNGLSVHLAGYVDDLAKQIANSIMIVPLLTGSGMRMKILDAAAMSLPFVTTSVGAEGLEFKDGESCLFGDSPETFTHQLERLLTDRDLRESIARSAHQVYTEKYNLSSLIGRRDDIYRKLLTEVGCG